MLCIDNKEFLITKKQVKVSEFIVNGENGFNLDIKLEFSYEERNGYLNLSVGYEKDDDINNFLNREYVGIPFESDINFFEVYDTNKFLDTEIESEIIVKLENIKNNEISTFIQVNDELIYIMYEGELDMTI